MSPRPFFKIAGLLAATICCGSSVAVEVEAVVEVRSAMVVAFLPPRLQSSKDGEALNAASHLSFAVADTTACVKPLKLVVRTVYANRIVLQHASRREVVAVPATGQGIGAILVAPGRSGRLVVSEIGPSALVQLVPQAASEYWHAPSCSKRGA